MEWVKIFENFEAAKARLTLNKPQLLIVHGKKICLVLVEHQLLAVQDACPHNGESLSKGTVNFLGEVVCPWHGQRFNLKTGREGAERSPDLITYPLKEDADGIFIGL